jgi:hypothetical protein
LIEGRVAAAGIIDLPGPVPILLSQHVNCQNVHIARQHALII